VCVCCVHAHYSLHQIGSPKSERMEGAHPLPLPPRGGGSIGPRFQSVGRVKFLEKIVWERKPRTLACSICDSSVGGNAIVPD
jgi:hypothetical protein